jgi:flagellar capping protein FliD
VKSDAEALKDATDALSKKALYKPKTDEQGNTLYDEDGNKVYDTDSIKKSVQEFVTAYNSYMDSAGSVENTSVLNKTLSIVKKTASNQNLLKEVGITIGKDNKLTLDEEKLESAHITTLTSLFQGNSSYGDSVSQKAAESYKVANSEAYTNTRASSYTYNGAYSILGTANGTLDKYL